MPGSAGVENRDRGCDVRGFSLLVRMAEIGLFLSALTLTETNEQALVFASGVVVYMLCHSLVNHFWFKSLGDGTQEARNITQDYLGQGPVDRNDRYIQK